MNRAVSPSPGPSGHPLPVGDDSMDGGGRATTGSVAEGESARPPAAGSWVGALTVHDLLHYVFQFFIFIRLGHRLAETVFAVIRHNRIVRVAAGCDDACLWIDFQQFLYSFTPAHATRHHQIHNNHIERRPLLLCFLIQSKRFAAFMRKLDLVPEMGK